MRCCSIHRATVAKGLSLASCQEDERICSGPNAMPYTTTWFDIVPHERGQAGRALGHRQAAVARSVRRRVGGADHARERGWRRNDTLETAAPVRRAGG